MCSACARRQPLRGPSRAAALHVSQKDGPQPASWVTGRSLAGDTTPRPGTRAREARARLGTGWRGGGGQRQDKPHSPRRLAPRRWGPRSPQAGCSAESTPTSEVLQKAAGVHTRLESRGCSRVGEVKQSSTFSPRNSHGMPVFVVTLGVIVCIPASADKKTTFDLQSRVAISRGLPRKAESQVPGLSPRWAQMGRAPATWGVSPDGAHGAGFCSRQPGTGR